MSAAGDFAPVAGIRIAAAAMDGGFRPVALDNHDARSEARENSPWATNGKNIRAKYWDIV
jgi:hypothetical protein